ncbi:hypothetical protein [Streptomyces sp. NPDC047928]|uniref:hypothetical protein n=1 Tax=unclassified Streptomyces TaxID=2593676 RepID=UPI003714779C
MNRSLARVAPPGPEFLVGVGVASWVDRRTGSLPCLLVTGRTRDSALGLRGMALGLWLAPVVARRVPVGRGRLLRRGDVIALDYGHDSCLLHVPTPGPVWLSRAAALGAVRVTVGLDPLRLGADREEVGTYMGHLMDTGRAFTGICVATGSA